MEVRVASLQTTSASNHRGHTNIQLDCTCVILTNQRNRPHRLAHPSYIVEYIRIQEGYQKMKVKYTNNDVCVTLEGVVAKERTQEALKELASRYSELDVTVESVYFTDNYSEDTYFYSGDAYFTLSVSVPFGQEPPEYFTLTELND